MEKKLLKPSGQTAGHLATAQKEMQSAMEKKIAGDVPTLHSLLLNTILTLNTNTERSAIKHLIIIFITVVTCSN